MNRVRIAAMAAGLTVAMVVGVLVGGALSTANADGGRDGTTFARPAPWYFTGDDGEKHFRGSTEYERLLAERDAPAERGAAEEDDAEAEAEAVTCSLVDGCTVNVVDEDGEVVKVMHITFTDAEDAEVSLE